MIQFFRRIRQNLLADNKFSKYLLYAIGEILLVVIGILIALQINAWNEEKKARKLEATYLKELHKELEFNIQIAREQIRFSDFQIRNGEIILASLIGTIPENPMDMAIAIEHIGWNHEIIFISNVWNELYATGNIGIIQNSDIKSRLTDMYNVMSLINKFQEHEWSSYNLGVRRLLGDILPPEMRLVIDDNLAPGSYFGEDFDFPDLAVSVEKLKSLEGLSGYIVDIIETRRTSNELILGAIASNKDIMALIEKELD